jgi:hypothetical protein
MTATVNAGSNGPIRVADHELPNPATTGDAGHHLERFANA